MRSKLALAFILTVMTAGCSSGFQASTGLSSSAISGSSLGARIAIPATGLSLANGPSSQSIQVPCGGATSVSQIDATHFLGRKSKNCSGADWSLSLLSMDWSSGALKEIGSIFQPTQTIGKFAIGSAYDPTFMDFNGEKWVAFECVGPGMGGVSACVGPFTESGGLDTNRSSVVIEGGSVDPASANIYSASVPKLLSFQGHVYLYWSVVNIRKADNLWQNITTRGTELRQESGGQRRFWAVGAQNSIRADDPSTQEVFGVDANDPRSNRVADSFQVFAYEANLFLLGAKGGGACVNPNSDSPGCYRLSIASSPTPLGYHIFNHDTVPESFLPGNAEEYVRIVQKPDGTLALLGNYMNPRSDTRNPMPGGMQIIALPDPNFFTPEYQASIGLGLTPGQKADATTEIDRAYSDFLGRAPSLNELNSWLALYSANGLNFSTVQNGIQNSPEAIVRRAFLDLLGREPDPAGLASDIALLQGGMTEAQLRAGIMTSGEYLQRVAAAQNAAAQQAAAAAAQQQAAAAAAAAQQQAAIRAQGSSLITQAYAQYLSRTAGADEIASWLNIYLTNGNNISSIQSGIQNSPEAIVRRAYLDLLGRQPDPEGLTNDIGLLQSGWTEAQLRAGIMTSSEYLQRVANSLIP